MGRLTLVLGGVASGKSEFAEALVLRVGGAPVYVATAEAHDDEMRAKIAIHQARRQGAGWLTREAPRDLGAAFGDLPEGAIVLIDCATMWLSNHLLAGEDGAELADALVAIQAACPAPVVVVSNEVGLGGVAANALARAFAAAQGSLNRALAAEAGVVVQVVAGLPQVLKGSLP